MTYTKSTSLLKKHSRSVQPSATNLPPLFIKPEVVNLVAHGGLYFTPLVNDDVLRQTHALPLILQEVVAAAADVPMLFVKENEHWGIIALTGMRADESYSVDKTGPWQGYRPQYLNLYPFIAGTLGASEQVLCIDRAYAGLSEDGNPESRPLFTQDGLPEAWLVQIQADISRYKQATVASSEAVCRLASFGVLRAATAGLKVSGTHEQVLDGFFMVDWASVNALPAETLAACRDEGLLEVIYAHLVSLQHLPVLVESTT